MKTLLLGLALPDSYDGQDPDDVANVVCAAINFARHAGDRYPDKAIVSLFPAPQWLDPEVLDRLRHWASTPVPTDADAQPAHPEPDRNN